MRKIKIEISIGIYLVFLVEKVLEPSVTMGMRGLAWLPSAVNNSCKEKKRPSRNPLENWSKIPLYSHDERQRGVPDDE